MENTKKEYSLERDGYSKTFSIPRALMAIELLSEKERMIIAKITNLTSKYIDKGGCNLSNTVLAKRHFCSVPVVSNAISKAHWLGFQQQRTDERYSYTTENGATAYIQNRRLMFVIPDYWEFFGEVWAEHYFKGCPAAFLMLDWLNNTLKKEWEQKNKNTALDEKELLTKFKHTFFTNKGFENYLNSIELENYNLQEFKNSKGGVLKSLRPFIEKFKSPFLNLYAFMFMNNKFINNKFTNIKLHSSDLTVEENDPSINSTNLTGEDLTEEDNAPVRIKRKNLPNSETKNSKPSAKERSKKYLPLAEQLSEIIRTKKNVKTTARQLSSWANEIRILVESNGVDYDRIQTVLNWYADHIGEEYIPVIESGNSLRHKFLRLEDAMKRQNRNQKSPPGYQTSRSGVTIGSGITGTYAGIDEIALQYQREQEALEKKKRK